MAVTKDRSVGSEHPRVLITGIGRSGTGYMSKLLTAAGLPCGHEKLYHERSEHPTAWLDAQAEASWFAVPWIGYERTRHYPDLLAVHLVRNPMAWLSSWVLTTWAPRKRRGVVTKYLERATGFAWGDFAEQDVIHAAMSLWINWNRRAARQCNWTRCVERITATSLTNMLEWADVPTDRVEQALARVPTNVNARKHGVIGWDQCESKPCADAFAELAREYGYDDLWNERNPT